MKLAILTIFLVVFSSVAIAHNNGTHRIKSKNSPTETMNKIEGVVKEKGMKVFARIDHAAGAVSVGQTLPAAELLIFGNPKGGTPLMQCNLQVGLDLPLKILVWSDDKQQTWISYNEPAYYAKRYQLGECGNKVITKITNLLELITLVGSK